MIVALVALVFSTAGGAYAVTQIDGGNIKPYSITAKRLHEPDRV
jgi:hypothetical protein